MITPTKESVTNYVNKVMQNWLKDDELEFTSLTNIMNIDNLPAKANILQNGRLLAAFKMDGYISWVYLPNEVECVLPDVTVSPLPFMLDEDHLGQVLAFDKLFSTELTA